jgi:hypothetical protein
MNIESPTQTQQLYDILVSGSGLTQKYRVEYPGIRFGRGILSEINDIKIEYCKETSKLLLTRNNILIKEIQMYIWLPEPTKPDFWFEYRIINNQIIILQDYYGVRLFNLDLDILFDLPVPVTVIYDDVYGCEVDLEKREVSVWLMDKTQEVSSEIARHDPTVISEELSDEELVKLTRKARKEYSRKFYEFKSRYEIHYGYKHNDGDDIQFNVPSQCIRTYSF